jgi:hypothetical protein
MVVPVMEPTFLPSVTQNEPESAHIFPACKRLLDVLVRIQSAGFSRGSEAIHYP